MLFLLYCYFVHPAAVAVLVMRIRNAIKILNFLPVVKNTWNAENVIVVTGLPQDLTYHIMSLYQQVTSIYTKQS